jgi:hypothetical protein
VSKDLFEDDCADCRPVLINSATGQVFSADSIEMRAVNAVWETTELADRQAFHRVTCLNSRAPTDLQRMQDLSQRIEKKIAAKIDN